VSIQTQGDRIIVGDIQESVHYARYLYQENLMVVFADDSKPRWLTRMTMLDYNTVASADKFGNFCVNRLPKQVADQVEEDVTGSKLIHEKEYLNGAPHRVRLRAVLLPVLLTKISLG
jgi:splicing factor 3B subunit 3